MNIGIITYNIAHLKTQQLIAKLTKKNYDITIFITKFKKYKKRNTLLNHRPFQFIGEDPFVLSKKFNLKLYEFKNLSQHKFIDFYLIGGSGIIEKKYIKKNKIINCHPGLIPMTRGLDSFKWSLLKNHPIGNTLHFVDSTIDNGKIISHKLTPVYNNDNLFRLATRHYNMEINMLANFEQYLKNSEIFNFKKNKPFKRMPLILEKELIKNFKNYKSNNFEHK